MDYSPDAWDIMLKNHYVLSSLSLLAIFVLVVTGYFVSSINDLPDIESLNSCFVGKMHQVPVCASNSNYVALESVSQTLINALIVSEDASFWHHKGVDWYELKQSMQTNLATGSFKRGGSTISQQLIKNAFLSGEKSIIRKIKEFLLTRRLEARFQKKFILEKYINIVEFGPGLYGIKPAAQFYFNKSPSQLGPLESAYLVHLLPSPKKYSDTFTKGQLTEFSKKMVLLICKRLSLYKKISEDEYQSAVRNIDRFPWYGLSFDTIQWDPSLKLELDEELDELLDSDSPFGD